MQSNMLRQTDERKKRSRPFVPGGLGMPRGDDLRGLGGMIVIERNGMPW
ncbi:MAG: hypothetical protein KDD88_03460 [Rhodobacteraceae bacterium]|nr:hypothetical protein [Paracoccaceae bacterium]